jgi:hypothetical protein
MRRSRIKPVLSVVGGCSLLFLAVTYTAGELSSPSKAVDAALAECRAKGWQENDLGRSKTCPLMKALGTGGDRT